jgi:hypothetical protein
MQVHDHYEIDNLYILFSWDYLLIHFDAWLTFGEDKNGVWVRRREEIVMHASGEIVEI